MALRFALSFFVCGPVRLLSWGLKQETDDATRVFVWGRTCTPTRSQSPVPGRVSLFCPAIPTTRLSLGGDSADCDLVVKEGHAQLQAKEKSGALQRSRIDTSNIT